jgi:hypothetical protein
LGELTDDDVQEGDQGERQPGRQRACDGLFHRPGEQGDDGLKKVRQRRLADPTQAQAGEGDPQLSGGDEAIGLGHGALGPRRGAVTLACELSNARAADADQRKLCRDEESIRQHENDDAQQTQEIEPERRHAASAGDSGAR